MSFCGVPVAGKWEPASPPERQLFTPRSHLRFADHKPGAMGRYARPYAVWLGGLFQRSAPRNPRSCAVTWTLPPPAIWFR